MSDQGLRDSDRVHRAGLDWAMPPAVEEPEPPRDGMMNIDELATLGEATVILARLRGDRSTSLPVGDAAGLGYAAIQILLDSVLQEAEGSLGSRPEREG